MLVTNHKVKVIKHNIKMQVKALADVMSQIQEVELKAKDVEKKVISNQKYFRSIEVKHDDKLYEHDTAITQIL